MGISGNVYIADSDNNKIRMVTSTGIIATFAGTGTLGDSGDGGAATSAQLSQPYGVSVDITGNVYITDFFNKKIRMVTSTGIIRTFAGTGTKGSSGDGGAATSAQLSYPYGVAMDLSGNVYIADTGNYKIRMVNRAGIITTFAGTGAKGSSGDGAATSSQLGYPQGVSVDISGNVYIADPNNRKIHVVKPVCPAGLFVSGSANGASQCTTTSPPTSAPTFAPSALGSPTPRPPVGATVTVQCTQVFINANTVSKRSALLLFAAQELLFLLCLTNCLLFIYLID